MTTERSEFGTVPVIQRLGTEPGLSTTNSVLGGKGSTLAQLISAGFPVPATGVVTTEAYRRAGCHELACRMDLTSTDGRPADSDIDSAFGGIDIETPLADQIFRLVNEVGGGGPVAIRSSATVEDLGGASFAGQYRSFLNIDSKKRAEVMRSVRLVWASLWHAAPVAYRRAFVPADADIAMAVVIMAMVPASSAGVVFTEDPGGRPGHCRIEAVEGLGEALVSGARTPNAWVVPRAPSSRPPLPAPIACALDHALAIESVLGVAVDVEWAAADDVVEGDVMVVQARPITVSGSGDGFDSPVDHNELTTAGIVEMVPGVLPALIWELNHYLLEEAFRSFLDTMEILHGSEAEERSFIRRVRGRVALDFGQLRGAVANLGDKAAIELENKYFGQSGWATALDVPPSGRRNPLRILGDLRADLRAISARARVTQQADVVVRAVDCLPDRGVALGSMNDAELLAYIERLIDVAARGLAAELGVAAAAADAYQRLESFLRPHLGDAEAERQAQLLTGGSLFAEPRSSGSAAFFAGPSWEELERTPPSIPAETSATVRQRRDQLDDRLRSLPGWNRTRWLTGQVVDIRLHLMHRAAAAANTQLRRREATKLAVLALGGEVRRAHLEVGVRLVDRGLLRNPHDIELMTTTEVSEALAGTARPLHLERRRNWIRRYESEGPLPVRFTGTPRRRAEPLPTGDVLRGWASSPGRYSGRARVVTTPADRFEDGEVLVANATDASWSPLFLRAGAVVVEQGGPLSHAAILARELGLPAVLNIRGATQLLADQSVTVDGDTGSVVISQDGPRGANGGAAS